MVRDIPEMQLGGRDSHADRLRNVNWSTRFGRNFSFPHLHNCGLNRVARRSHISRLSLLASLSVFITLRLFDFTTKNKENKKKVMRNLKLSREHKISSNGNIHRTDLSFYLFLVSSHKKIYLEIWIRFVAAADLASFWAFIRESLAIRFARLARDFSHKSSTQSLISSTCFFLARLKRKR